MSYVYSWILQLLIVLLTSGIFIWKYSTRKFDYWKKRGVFNPQPVPFLGNLSDILFMRKNLADLIKTLYSTTDLPYLGFFAFDEPYLMVRCPKLIQRVLIKDFSYFSDRSVATPPHDEIMASFTFLQKNPAWKRTRNKLTPVFTSGKIKRMFTFVNSVGENLVDYLQKNLGDIEAKEVASKYSTDVIAKCCFGIESKCFDDEDIEFRKFGRNMFDFTWRNAVAFVIYFFRPRWVGTFRVDFINQSSIKFFCQAFSETMNYRKLCKMKVGDFADLINDLKEASHSRESALNEAYGQAIMFFAAGFETTSAAISFTLYELCLNKNIQDKLRKEISETIGEYGEVTYEAIQKMKYLRMCIDETLRKYPIIAFLDRICKEDYEVPNTNLVIEKGTPIYIPIYGLHMDETYFTNPEKYDPDRFLKKNINEAGFVYMPFGEGPRKCLATKKACGQALMFFAAGFETTSSSISFTLHELCLNREVQNKVRAEILETIKNHGGITYESIQDMKYLKNCIYETLRKYPVLAFLDRSCIADYKLPGTDLVIEKGMRVYIPLAGLHLDEKYFEEPRKYNPDRFSEKMYNQNGLFYMPFGEGPRKCLGGRFGLISTQLALIHILSKFEVQKCAETPDPIEFEPKSILNLSKVGLPMILKRLTTADL